MKLIKVYPDRKVQIAILIADKACITILAKYSDFANIFFKESATILPEHTKINTHTINPEERKQLFYGSIYSLEPVELETYQNLP